MDGQQPGPILNYLITVKCFSCNSEGQWLAVRKIKSRNQKWKSKVENQNQKPFKLIFSILWLLNTISYDHYRYGPISFDYQP